MPRFAAELDWGQQRPMVLLDSWGERQRGGRLNGRESASEKSCVWGARQSK